MKEFNGTKFNCEWNTKNLLELGTIERGKSKHRPRNDESLFKNGSYPFVQTADIKDANLYVLSHTQNYNEKGLKQSKLWDKDTLCITISANIAETALLNYPACFPDSIVGFIANKSETTEQFMYYLLEYVKNTIQKRATGSTQDNINIDYLSKLDFKIPTLNKQQKIVDILMNIDKQIMRNNDMIQKLPLLNKGYNTTISCFSWEGEMRYVA